MPLDGCEVKREIVGVSARGGKAVEDYRTPRRCRVHRRPTDGAKRLGVFILRSSSATEDGRQPSGALGWTLFHLLDHEHFNGRNPTAKTSGL